MQKSASCVNESVCLCAVVNEAGDCQSTLFFFSVFTLSLPASPFWLTPLVSSVPTRLFSFPYLSSYCLPVSLLTLSPRIHLG